MLEASLRAWSCCLVLLPHLFGIIIWLMTLMNLSSLLQQFSSIIILFFGKKC